MKIQDRLRWAIVRSSQNDLKHAADSLARAGLKDLAREARRLREQVMTKTDRECRYCEGTRKDPYSEVERPAACPACSD